MKKILLCWALLATFALSATAQYYRVERWNSGNKKLEVVGSGNDSLVTGTFEDGNRMVEGRYMYGKYIGAWTYWYPSGQKQLVMYFDSLSISNYKNDVSVKGKLIKSVSYYDTGELEKVDNYNEGKHLFSSVYTPNGHIKELVTYIDEVPTSGISWYENGSVNEMNVFLKEYKTEKTSGKDKTTAQTTTLTYKKWHENGQIALDGQVDAKGKKIGVWHLYDTMGNLLKTEEY